MKAKKLEAALKTFEQAQRHVASRNLLGEMEWQRTRRFAQFTESDLLREAAWVILCSGFREAIVRKVFDRISLSFCDWESARAIVASAGACRANALSSINNQRKMDGILGVARRIDDVGFSYLKAQILRAPTSELGRLPFVGPVTSWHLAKNLGFEVAKPDRHLFRMSQRLGFSDAQELCKSIAQIVNEPVHVVDIVLWRYAADRFGLPGRTETPRLDLP
jgi:hypothetical protein